MQTSLASLPNLRSHHPSHHLLGRQTFPRRQQLFRSRPPNHRLAKRFRRSRRFHERRVIPRGNRPNRPARFRWLLLFDRRLRSLRNHPSLSSRAAPQRRPLHHGRSISLSPETKTSPRHGHAKHPSHNYFLLASANGRRRRPGNAALRQLRHQLQSRSNRRRHADDSLRSLRRNVSHNVGPNHKSHHAADLRHRDHAISPSPLPLSSARTFRRRNAHGPPTIRPNPRKQFPATRHALPRPTRRTGSNLPKLRPNLRHSRPPAHPSKVLHRPRRSHRQESP